MYGRSARDQGDVSLAQLLLCIHPFDRFLILVPDLPTAIKCSLDDCSSEMAIEGQSATEEN